MKNLPFLFATLFSLFLILNACESTVKQDTETTSSNSEIKEPSKVLRHVVLFKFKESANPEILKKIEDGFVELPNKISEIHSFEWGMNNSPEGLDKGLTHCYLVTFLSEEDRDKYLPHPAHLQYVDLIKPHIEDVTVVDYWTK